MRPRRPAGPEHWVKSPMVGRCLSHCDSQARWQSQNRWLECRRLQGTGQLTTHLCAQPLAKEWEPLPLGGAEPPCCSLHKHRLHSSQPAAPPGAHPQQWETSQRLFLPAQHTQGNPLGWILPSKYPFTSLSSHRPTAPNHVMHFQTHTHKIINFLRKNQT